MKSSELPKAQKIRPTKITNVPYGTSYIQWLGLVLLSFHEQVPISYIGSVKNERKRGQNSRTGKLYAKTRRVSCFCVLQRSTTMWFNASGNLKRPWMCYKVTLML